MGWRVPAAAGEAEPRQTMPGQLNHGPVRLWRQAH